MQHCQPIAVTTCAVQLFLDINPHHEESRNACDNLGSQCAEDTLLVGSGPIGTSSAGLHFILASFDILYPASIIIRTDDLSYTNGSNPTRQK